MTGKPIREVLAAEILEPLGFRWNNYGVAPADVAEVGLSYVTGAPVLPPLSQVITRALGAPLDDVVKLSNDPRFLTAIVPSANVVTNANELSRFFEILRAGGELDGVRVIEAETIRRALTEQSRLEIDFSLVFPTRFSYGLMLGAKVISLYGRDTDLAFGHLGLINIMGWADPERGISAALVTSGKPMLYPELPRFYGVMQRIASEVPKVPRRRAPPVSEAEGVIRRAYRAFAARDLEALIEIADDEIEVSTVTGRMAGRTEPYRGAVGLAEYMDDLAATWKRIELQPQNFQPLDDDRMLVFGRVRAWHENGFLDSSNAWLWTLRGGLVTEVRVFADPGDAREFIAPPV